MPAIKRSGKSSGGTKGKVGTSNIFSRGSGKGPAKRIKKMGTGHGGKNC